MPRSYSTSSSRENANLLSGAFRTGRTTTSWWPLGVERARGPAPPAGRFRSLPLRASRCNPAWKIRSASALAGIRTVLQEACAVASRDTDKEEKTRFGSGLSKAVGQGFEP